MREFLQGLVSENKICAFKIEISKDLYSKIEREKVKIGHKHVVLPIEHLDVDGPLFPMFVKYNPTGNYYNVTMNYRSFEGTSNGKTYRNTLVAERLEPGFDLHDSYLKKSPNYLYNTVHLCRICIPEENVAGRIILEHYRDVDFQECVSNKQGTVRHEKKNGDQFFKELIDYFIK